MHTPIYGILNIIFCPKTGVFGLFGMLGTPKPMEEIAPRHHKVFFLCLRHKNPSEFFFQKNRRPKSVTTHDVQQRNRSCACALCPHDGGLVPWPVALARIFFQSSKQKLCYNKRNYICSVVALS